MGEIIRATRFSGADWADQLKEIMIIGIGGIGSWLSLSLSRIGHTLYLIDGDMCDESNVNGGQLYRTQDVGKKKVYAVAEICREFGCINQISTIDEMWNGNKHGITPIVISGLDNMETRKRIFEAWLQEVDKFDLEDKKDPWDYLLIDGRLLIETAEVFTLQGNKQEQIDEYKKNWLFDDSEIPEVECTTKQSTFAAMTIAGMMTASLCNWLTNRKLDMDFREVPFHQRLFYPAFDYKIKEATTKIELHGRDSSKTDKKEENTTV